MNNLKNMVWSLLTVIFFACSSTQTTATWSKPDQEPAAFQKIAVLGVMGNLGARKSFETEMASRLQKENIPAIAAMKLLPPQKKPVSIDQMIKRLHQEGIDAILVVNLSDVDRKREYIRSTTYIQPRTYYHRFGDYYLHSYHRVHTPGYVRRSTTYFLESTLYDLVNQQMLWTSESKSTDAASLKSVSRSYARSIVKSLDKDQII